VITNPEESPNSAAVLVELRSDATVSYASYQNSIALCREIVIENKTPFPLADVQVSIIPEPDFAEALVFRFERLDSGDKRTISPIPIKLRHAYLAGLTEAERGRLRIEVRSGAEIVASTEAAVEVLAYDQWGGTRGVPELLAAFSLPNNPIVDRIIHAAAETLGKSGNGLSIHGYHAKDRHDVWAQISAIYGALAKYELQYSVPPASFASNGQKIRTPDRIIEGGVATCLDLTMLFSGCLEQAGLNPVLLLKEGHSWIGCWLLNTSFPGTITDDAQAIRKRIDAGELITFETTGLGQRPIPSLRISCETGLRYLHENADQFRFAIDIRRARIERIQPLPSKNAPTPTERAIADQEPLLEPAPAFPSLAGETVLLDEDNKVDTAEGRLSRWKGKLLDLTRRNRLLNFKATKVMVPLRIPDLGKLEDELSDGKEWKFRPQTKIMEGADPRSANLALLRSGEDPIEAMALAAMRDRELLAMVEKDKLDSQLYEIYLQVRANLEEGGANTLFLALGFLRWTEDENSEIVNLAPILLIPVTLHRASVRSGFSIVRHDDETVVNPTLLQMLRENFGVDVKGLDPLPTDESGVDVEKILSTFRQAVKEIPKWEVNPDVYLGVFSFTKYLMWKDLKDRTADLKKNRVVGHLIDRPREPIDRDPDIANANDLDERHLPGSLLTPMMADSSQLNAVSRAGEGHDFVLEGPPGTGKSQTITNLIAHFLGIGKRVLFVSEKMAALGVVERRLNSIGLGPFCLQLHSAKARKTEVLERLRKSLDIANAGTSADWEIEAERIARLRAELNGLVRALHFVHPNGLTVRGGLDCAIKHREWQPVPIESGSIDALDQRGLNDLRELAASMQTALEELAPISGHPLTGLLQEDWSYAWEDKLAETCSGLDAAAAALRGRSESIFDSLGLHAETASMKSLNDVDALAEVLLQAPSVPIGFATRADDKDLRNRIEAIRDHGVRRNEAWNILSARFRSTVSQLRGAELEKQWVESAGKWWPGRFASQYSVTTALKVHAEKGRRPSSADVPEILRQLKALNEHEGALAASEAESLEMLGSQYKGLETDWTAVQNVEVWGQSADATLERFQSIDDPLLKTKIAERFREFVGAKRELLASSGQMARRLVEYRESVRILNGVCAAIRELAANPGLFKGSDSSVGILTRIQASAQHWQTGRQSSRLWCKWQGLRSRGLKSGLGKVIAAIEKGDVPEKHVAKYADYAYQVWWLKGIIDREAILRTFSSSDHERKIREFRDADERFQKLTEKFIFAKLASKVPDSGQKTRGSEMAILSRELAKQRAHYPVRKLVQQIPNLLPQLKPCLLMSPISVAQYLDAGHCLFDVVIFDEASQIPVWDAVGAIARGKQLIVVGDPKQLPPTSFFERREEEYDGEEDVDENQPVKDLESILDECMGTGMTRLSLDWHYRSKHESLIAFSNTRYYDSRLITFPSPVTKDVAVQFVPVSGTYDRGGSRTNRAEAEAIVARICGHFGQDDPKLRTATMGVVTFNLAQMRLIDDLLQAQLLARPELEDRIAAHGDERLFIKNLENVQGDERDVILFSITFGRDQSGKMPMNFGPINQDGGHRRLNVAITRARTGVEIFSSIRPEDIDLSRTRAQGVADLKAYLDYAIRGARAIAEESLPTGKEPDSPFEIEVIKTLRDAGWEVHPQVGCSGYRIDIGIVDKARPGRYLVGIECDGATYHSMKTARDRDRLRQSVLESLGWKILRVWSTDWWADRARISAALIKKVSDITSSGNN
jgi:very-short-patch-repair endonuclease